MAHNKIIKVYCEGKNGSIDAFLLSKLLPYPTILVKPVGGKKGAKSAVQALEEVSIEETHFYLLFRDRDFDKPIPVEPKLEQMTSSYEYCSYRNTIENYLLNTLDFYDFILENGLNEKCGIQSEMEVEELFLKAAKKIKVYQAVRHTLGKMRSGKANFGTKWTSKSGRLPDKLDREYCRGEALMKMINKAKNEANVWTEERFDAIFEEFIILFDEQF
ncbi:MAG: hypothetical protein AAF960_13370, partial [Bacteroidota bacterium]